MHARRPCSRASRAARLSAFLTSLSLTVSASVAAQTAVVEGLVIDANTRRPVPEAVVMLAGTSFSALTRADGNFRLPGVPAGTFTLRVSHLAYGEHTERIDVGAGEVVRLRITLSQAAITLEPISVEALSTVERAARGSGARLNVVTREEIERHVGTSMTMADVLMQHVAGVRVRRRENLVGQPICIEFRGGTAGPGRCNSPAVFLDGVRITNPTILYQQVDLRTIERMEVIPAAEAGVRFGTGALYGALLIESRRPGSVAAAERRTRYVEPVGFDWAQEPLPHRSTRVYAISLAASAVGLALGVAAAQQCIKLRDPARDRVVTDCEGLPTLGAAVAALALPALGGGIASRLTGRTERSSGRLLPALIGASMVLIPGYALLLSSQRNESPFLEWTGRGLLVLGVPFAVTTADRLFRSVREDWVQPPPR